MREDVAPNSNQIELCKLQPCKTYWCDGSPDSPNVDYKMRVSLGNSMWDSVSEHVCNNAVERVLMRVAGRMYTFDEASHGHETMKIARDLPTLNHDIGAVRFEPDGYGSAEVGTEMDLLYIVKNSKREADGVKKTVIARSTWLHRMAPIF